MTYWPGTVKGERQLAQEAKIKGDAEWGIDDEGDLASVVEALTDAVQAEIDDAESEAAAQARLDAIAETNEEVASSDNQTAE